MRQLDAACGELLARAWGAGARPERLVIDLDSSITEVHGYKRAGARYGHTRVLGYHPLIATSALSGDVIHARLRHGAANTQKGVVRFFSETIARCRRAGHRGEFLVRADPGFVNYTLFRAIRRHGGDVSVAVDAKHRAGAHPLPATLRLVVRRVLNHDPNHPQQPLFTDYRYFPILTSRADALALVEAEHHDHAQVELVIRDPKDAGMAHIPSGRIYANMAWLVLAYPGPRPPALGRDPRPRRAAHHPAPHDPQPLPGDPGAAGDPRPWRLRRPAGWPWRERFLTAIERLRALPTPA